jgi:hypothetical protein
MMSVIPDGYRMSCDYYECENGYAEHPVEGETESVCLERAVKHGWLQVAEGVWFCPSCAISTGHAHRPKLQPRRYKNRCSCRRTKFHGSQWDTDLGQGYPGTGAAHIWKYDVERCQGCGDEVGVSKSGKPFSRPTK